MSISYRCWAEVDLGALRNNLAWIRHRVGPDVRIMTVVKADAYGHGLKQIAALLMQSGTDVFGVANLGEARAIRSVGRGWPILMLGACLPDEVATAIRDDVMVSVSSLDEARGFSKTASKLGRPARLHVKVDTGMGRLGVSPGAALALVTGAAALPGIRVEGLYTHYASVEDDAGYSQSQRTVFARLLAELRERGVAIAMIHANNSGALLHEPDSLFNLVRPGLLVYGIPPVGARCSTSDLRRQVRAALSFRCRVSFVKEISRGARLSYGGSFVAPRRMRVATLTAGYGDGYLRAGSNRASVVIHGQRCPVLGRITMDQTIVDVSKLRGVRAGEEAVLIGRQGRDEITAGELADWCGTIPWEVLTSISYRVPRVYRGAEAA
jgi:alanine racemase